jgi:predicted heme/steroid binding protein
MLCFRRRLAHHIMPDGLLRPTLTGDDLFCAQTSFDPHDIERLTSLPAVGAIHLR